MSPRETANGNENVGKAKGMHHKWVNCDGAMLHFTQPLQGNRISVINRSTIDQAGNLMTKGTRSNQ